MSIDAVLLSASTASFSSVAVIGDMMVDNER